MSSRREDWFDRGSGAFKRSFPELAARIPWPRFYVCPLCLSVFNERSLTIDVPEHERLTAEHVPPRSVGGKRMLLTCRDCNSTAGSGLDSHMRREADTHDFLKGNLQEIQADMIVGSETAPIRVSISDNQIRMYGVPRATRPETLDAVTRSFDGATVDESWKDFEFKIEFKSYSEPRAAVSWLRSAYLAFFSALGYRFICRREMKIVRDRIENPDAEVPVIFRIVRPEESEPRLLRIEEPEVCRSFAMFYGHHMIFLPRYNDHHLFERLAELPEGRVDFRAKQYPWPTPKSGPLFLHDQASTSEVSALTNRGRPREPSTDGAEE